MTILKRIAKRIIFPFRKGRLEQDLEEEIRFHLEMEVEANLRAGVDPAEARRRALLAFGGMERYKTQAREARGGLGFEKFLQDLRLSARTLVGTPLFSGAIILVLGLGIGASTAIFSVVNGVVLRPLPYPDPDRLVAAHMTDEEDGDFEVPWSVPSLRDAASEQVSLASLTGWGWIDVTLTGIGDPAVIYAVGVSDGMLTTFGIQPFLGRDIRPEESLSNGPRVTVLTHSFWQEQLGGDEGVLGRTLRLSNQTYEVVGVAPPGFAFPSSAALWIPGHWSEDTHPRGRHFLRGIGRLNPGTPIETAQAELSSIAARLEEEHPETNRARGIHLVPLKEQTVGDVRLALLILLGAVGMVLLIACANVANLLLARGAARMREVAVRATLGAGNGDIVRLLMTETGLLVSLGGTLGVVLALLGVKGFLAASPGGIPRLGEIAVDGTSLVVALGLVVTVTVMVGFLPGYRSANTSIAAVIREGKDKKIQVGDRRITQSGLLTLEVALSLVLLLGAGLMSRSLIELRRVDLGFDPENIYQFTLTLPEAGYHNPELIAFQAEFRGRLATLPGVESVALINGNPLGRSHTTMGFEFVGYERDPEGPDPNMLIRRVSPGYFETLSIPLLRGRSFGARDREDGEPVAIISETAAARHWPGEDPIGHRFSFDLDDPDQPVWTIVGVVGDVRSTDIITATWPEAYFPMAQWPRSTVTAVVRTRPGSRAIEDAFRQVVGEMDSSLPLYHVESLSERIGDFMASDRFYLGFVGIFATLATILSAVGLYGVVAYLVSKRTREIGIRIALGAGRKEILSLVLSENVTPVLLGTVLGVAGALAGGQVLGSLLYQIRPWDPVALFGAVGLLVSVAGIATLIPARDAARIPPTVAMKVE